MELIVYNQTNAAYCCRSKPTIRFQRIGTIHISKSIAEQLQITDKSRLSFCQDKKSPGDWYLIVGDEDGFKIRKTASNSLVLNCSAVVNRVFSSLGLIKACSFPVSSEPTIIDNKAYYPIITKHKIKEI